MRTPIVVVGAGPAGLAMSAQLSAAGLDHVVLERGEAGQSWRTERWDSLRLLTPSWMCRLPGQGYEGDEPDGFLSAAATVAFLDAYQRRFVPGVRTHVTVEAAVRTAAGYTVTTDAGQWRCQVLVAATGSSSQPRIPPSAADLPARIVQLPALWYRRPDALPPDGDVLVVGASASGVQIADELRGHGRQVTLAVGEHIRLPRTYRGRDIYHWLDTIGQLDERYDEVDDINRARRHASVQLVGRDDRATIDLNRLARDGVRVVGRLTRIVGEVAQLSGSLANLIANADLKQGRLLRRIDQAIDAGGLGDTVGPPERPEPTHLGPSVTELDLRPVSTVIWATGYRPTSPWLDHAAFDRRGRLAHDGGVGALPGLYVLGLPFLRRRRSNLISGMGPDAADLLPHLRGHLDSLARQAARVSRSAVDVQGKQAAARAMDDVLDAS